jgi:hypothetical protein
VKTREKREGRSQVHIEVPRHIHEMVRKAAKLDPSYRTSWQIYAAGAERLAREIIGRKGKGEH